MTDRYRRYTLLARTAASKRPSQLAGVISRKARNRLVPALPVDVDGRYRRKVPDSLRTEFAHLANDNGRLRSSLSHAERSRYRRLRDEFSDGAVTFLNRTLELSDLASVTPDDRRLSDLPRLWFLKLVSFEPILWGVLSNRPTDSPDEFLTRVEAWIESCIAQERIGSRRGYLRGFWTPYAVSLRIIALSRYAAWRTGLDDAGYRFLYRNLLFLENNVEHDVGGNHLIENGAALVVGGTVFPDSGRRFVDAGLDVLRSSAASQFLDDGYHYERSPMYHLAVTERLLSAVSVLEAAGREPPAWLVNAAANACGFIEHLCPPDDRIPLLNDAVFGQSHGLDTVSRYGAAAGVTTDPPDGPGESALHWFGTDELTLLIDAGDSGPEQQLGHTHNDPCTILLWNDGYRMVTDTGVFDYRPGSKRSIARSVGAHNTVQVGDLEPAAYGGRFRMSEAAETTVAVSTKGEITGLTATYDATDSYCHRRSVYEGNGWLLLWDDIDTASVPSVSRLHAHPDVSVSEGSNLVLSHESGSDLHIRPLETDAVRLDTGPYFPEFGIERERSVVELRSQRSPFGYFVTSSAVDIDVERRGSIPVAVSTDERTTALPRPEL